MESALKGQLQITRQRTAPLILELDLTDGVLEVRPPDPLSAMLTRHQSTVADIVAGLKLARADDRVKALVVKVGGRPIGFGLVQELREAIKRFGATGKPSVAWAETFGEFSAGNVGYYLATACTTIYLQPSGDVGLTGLALERTFLRGALDKLGVRMEVSTRHEDKSAADMLTEHGYTPASREATERIAESITDQISDAVAGRLPPGTKPAQRGTPGVAPGPALAGGPGSTPQARSATRSPSASSRGFREVALPGQHSGGFRGSAPATMRSS
jgi:protease-4